jgi:hypothetical protein
VQELGAWAVSFIKAAPHVPEGLVRCQTPGMHVRAPRPAGRKNFRLEVSPSSPRLSVYQYVLLPFAGFLVGAVNAACPTAWPFLTFKKLIYGSANSPGTSPFLFCIFNPADELVSGDRRQIFPQAGYFFRPG